MTRNGFVLVALMGAMLSGCGGTETDAQEQETGRAEGALEQCLWFRATSSTSYEDACGKARQEGQNYCDTYGGGIKSVGKTCTPVTTADPYTADRYICCNH